MACKKLRCPTTYANDGECSQLCAVLFSTLKWMVGGVESLVLIPEGENWGSVEVLARGVQRLFDSKFVRVCIYSHVKVGDEQVTSEMAEMVKAMKECCERLKTSGVCKREDGEGKGEFLKGSTHVLNIMPKFKFQTQPLLPHHFYLSSPPSPLPRPCSHHFHHPTGYHTPVRTTCSASDVPPSSPSAPFWPRSAPRSPPPTKHRRW